MADSGASDNGPLIETHGLRRVFTSRGQVLEAVAGVDLNVPRGEIFGFLGPNGAGKTTTLRMLATLLPPSGGSASIGGYDLLRHPERIRELIGYVGQTGGADPQVSGRRELVLQGRLYGMGAAEAASRAAELIGVLELEVCADRRVSTYSGGQKRRLDIGIGLMHRPQLLFLDEPTTGLDPQARARMWVEVQKLRDQGMTVFLTTHYLEEADFLCDRVVIIDHGKIVAEGSPDELKKRVAGDVIEIGTSADQEALSTLVASQPYVRDIVRGEKELRVYVESGETALPQLIRLMDSHSMELTAITLTRPSLDDVFLNQTGRSLREGGS